MLSSPLLPTTPLLHDGGSHVHSEPGRRSTRRLRPGVIVASRQQLESFTSFL